MPKPDNTVNRSDTVEERGAVFRDAVANDELDRELLSTGLNYNKSKQSFLMSQDVDYDSKNNVLLEACEDDPIDHCDEKTGEKLVKTSESEDKLEEFKTERMSSKNSCSKRCRLGLAALNGQICDGYNGSSLPMSDEVF